MAYDPQRNRRQPDPAQPAAIDVLLGDADADSDNESVAFTEPEPPDHPSVTPTPADPWSDRQIYSTASVSTAMGVIIGLLILRWLWKRHTRRRN